MEAGVEEGKVTNEQFERFKFRKYWRYNKFWFIRINKGIYKW
jgi:hypothetical protein